MCQEDLGVIVISCIPCLSHAGAYCPKAISGAKAAGPADTMIKAYNFLFSINLLQLPKALCARSVSTSIVPFGTGPVASISHVVGCVCGKGSLCARGTPGVCDE